MDGASPLGGQDMLITVATGEASLANFQPAQQSAFPVTASIHSEDEVLDIQNYHVLVRFLY
jgi:hypothetical protein